MGDVKEIEVGGKKYKYDPDLSWTKWKGYLTTKFRTDLDRADWLLKNVVLEDPDSLSFPEVARLKVALERKLGLTNKFVKRLLRDTGKVSRGINVPYLSQKSLEFQVLVGMKGSIVKRLEDCSVHDILFYKKLLDEQHKQREDAIKEQEREAKANAQKARRRSRR